VVDVLGLLYKPNNQSLVKVITDMLRFLLLLTAFFSTANAAEKPNILFIFADDLGWKDVGYQGAEFMETPRIDAFAKTGMVFTDGYAPAANCQPSRACLLSGQYSPRHHVYAVKSTNRGPKNLMRLKPIPNKSGIAQEELSIGDALQSAGYTTGIFGKWHSGGPDGAEPLEQGFDVYYDSAMGGNPNLSTGKVQEDPKGVFSMTREVQKFMKVNAEAEKPFFAFMSHHAIHTALEAGEETLEYFQNKATTQEEKDLALYAACTKDLDTGVGILLDSLEELGIADNTLVVFTSDNGAHIASLQEPLRGNKGAYYEGGIREPFIVRWPGVTKAGTEDGTPVSNIDLFPTFADAAGATISEDKILDGESLCPLLAREGELKRKAIFWHFPGYLDRPVTRGRDTKFRTRPVSVIRKGDWKLFLYHEEWLLDGGREKLATNDAVELYNLAEDIGERNNLMNENVEKRDELLSDLLAWFEKTDAKLASKKD
jgi:arylsulfatase A-like enzyme